MLVLAALAVPATASAFHRDDVPVVWSTSGPGSASYAIRYDHPGGDFAIDLMSNGPQTAQSVSVAAWLFDANKQLVFGFAFTGHSSPDRMVLSPIGMTGSVDAVPDWLDVTAFTRDDTAEGPCAFACMGLEGADAPAGAYYYLLWVAGAGSSSLEVRSEAPAGVAVNVGPAWSVTDADMEGGDVNVQVQHANTLGAKAMANVATSIDVEDSLYAFWGSSDFKLACQFAAGACVWRSTLTYTCYGLGADCSTSHTSWSGPGGAGGSEPFASFQGSAPGAYTFTVDDKVDLYGPNAYDPTTGTWVFLGEEYTYFVGADNELP